MVSVSLNGRKVIYESEDGVNFEWLLEQLLVSSCSYSWS